MKIFSVLTLAALAWSAPAVAAPPAPVVSTAAAPAEFVLREGGFAARPPKGWTAARDARRDARQKVYGVSFSGPRSDDGILSAIDVAYYTPGSALFKGGAKEYLRRNRDDDPRFVKPVGETTGPLEKTVVGGRPASRFTRRSLEYIPPDRLDTKPVAVVEDVVVVPAGAGFYVVNFKAAEKLHDGLKPDFAGVLASLRFEAPKP